MLERPFKEVKRRTKVVGVFSNETSTQRLAVEIVLSSSEKWALSATSSWMPLEQSKSQTHNSRDVDAAEAADHYR